MTNPVGETNAGALRLDFDRRLRLQFRGSVVTSDAGLLAYRELDDALGLTDMASEVLADTRTGRNGRHALAGLFRQSAFGRLAGYENVNDIERDRPDHPGGDRRRHATGERSVQPGDKPGGNRRGQRLGGPCHATVSGARFPAALRDLRRNTSLAGNEQSLRPRPAAG